MSAESARAVGLLEEQYEEPIVEELSLGEWTFWEHYEDLPSASYQKDKKNNPTSEQYLASLQKVAWFNNVVTFWQAWQSLPISKLENFFYDKEQERLPT